MTSTFALGLAFMATTALSATIDLEFTGTARLSPGSPDPYVDEEKSGSDTDFIQVRDRIVANTGTFSAVVNPTLEADFKDIMPLSMSSNATVSLNVTDLFSRFGSRADANFTSTAIYRWNPVAGLIAGGSFSADVVDEGFEAVAIGQRGLPGDPDFAFGGPAIEAADVDSTETVIPFIAKGAPTGVSAKYTAEYGFILESAFELSGLTGTLVATNQDSGSVRSVDFFLVDDALDLNLDLSEKGIWDLELVNLGIDNRIISTLTLALRQGPGFGIEFPLADLFGEGCGDPLRDDDNGTLCAFDAGVEFFDTRLLYEDAVSSSVFTQNLDTTQFGSITVSDPIAPVPLPAGFPLYLAALGGLAFVRRQRSR
ncbi:MAG: VPLPA-CTERM sorting domain-containing protein [Pseudomonadota bacterium]